VPGGFALRDGLISVLVTGVSSISTSWSLVKWLSVNTKPDLVINIGIAGSYRDEIGIGNVVVPVSDCFADAGVETGKGFITLGEAGLDDPDRFPFVGGRIHADNRYVDAALGLMKPVNAITVNSATGSPETLKKMIKKFNPDIETMEGATFFYICKRDNLPFLAIRSVSNRVESRDKGKWNIPLALDNLSGRLNELFNILVE
jgi:futalosine hydrolase